VDESAIRDALMCLVPASISDSDAYPGSILSQASVAASPHTFSWSRLMDAIPSARDGRAVDIHARIERWALDESGPARKAGQGVLSRDLEGWGEDNRGVELVGSDSCCSQCC
jgi:hypothetical protein